MSSVSVIDLFSTVMSVVSAKVRDHKCESNLRKAGPFNPCECMSSVVLDPRVPLLAEFCFVRTYFQSTTAVVFRISCSRLAIYV